MLLIGISDSVHFLLLKPNANIGCANMFVSESVGSRALFAQVFVGVRRFRSMKSDRRQVWPHRRVQALVNTPFRILFSCFIYAVKVEDSVDPRERKRWGWKSSHHKVELLSPHRRRWLLSCVRG